MRWVTTGPLVSVLYAGSRPVGNAKPDGRWFVWPTTGRDGHRGRASPPTLEAAQAALEAELWAAAAQGLVQW